MRSVYLLVFELSKLFGSFLSSFGISLNLKASCAKDIIARFSPRNDYEDLINQA